MEELIKASEQISLFCRINVNTKKALPIRSSEMGMLIYLVKTEEEKTPLAVAKFFQVTKAMATNMTTSLWKQGYLEKKQSPMDKRSILLIPTKQAIQLVEETYEEYVKTMMQLQEQMGKQSFDTMVALLTQANEILLKEKNNG